MKLSKCLPVGLALALAHSSAMAATMIYTNEAAFNADLGGAPLTLDGFEDIVSNTSPPLDRGDYALSTAFDIDRSTSVISEGTQSLAIQEDTDAYAQFDFYTTQYAFAIDILDALDNGTSGGSLLVTIDGVETAFFTTPVDLANHNQLFLGLISDTGFTSVKVRGDTGGSNDVLRLDRMRYSSVSAVPVPASVWLFGTGLVGLVGVARRR